MRSSSDSRHSRLMLDLDASLRLRWLYRIARFRVTLGFAVAGPAFWLARPTWVSIGLGGLVALIGESVRVWAAGHLEKGREITRSGPYRLIRHPLYCGSLVVSAGFAIAAADMFVAALVVGYVLVTALAAIYLEEATLRDKFGDEYDRYVREFFQPATNASAPGGSARTGSIRRSWVFLLLLSSSG